MMQSVSAQSLEPYGSHAAAARELDGLQPICKNLGFPGKSKKSPNPDFLTPVISMGWDSRKFGFPNFCLEETWNISGLSSKKFGNAEFPGNLARPRALLAPFIADRDLCGPIDRAVPCLFLKRQTGCGGKAGMSRKCFDKREITKGSRGSQTKRARGAIGSAVLRA
ncbi:MAG: hypothetical protein ABSE69_11850 [Roseiarcus sp.]|jgi:hypothetical protein